MPAPPAIDQITVTELAEALKAARPPLVVDVREPRETTIAPFPGACRIPLRELSLKAHELPADRPLALLCHHGVRSRMAAEYLAGLGFSETTNIIGGIDSWSREVDPTVPRY